jgi:hypothetical protein
MNRPHRTFNLTLLCTHTTTNAETIVEMLTENEWAFREKEVEDFLRVAKDLDTGYIHFEDYVGLLATDK